MAVAQASSSADAPAGGMLSRKGRYLFGAVALLAVVLTAVLVPISKQRSSNKAAAPATPAATTTVSYADVLTALMEGNLAPVPDKQPTVVTPVAQPTLNTTTGKADEAAADAATVDPLDKLVLPTSGLGSKVMTQGWAALNQKAADKAEAMGTGVCTPKDGKEVVTMVSSPQCTVIVLTKGGREPYDITQTMNITSTKVRTLPPPSKSYPSIHPPSSTHPPTHLSFPPTHPPFSPHADHHR